MGCMKLIFISLFTFLAFAPHMILLVWIDLTLGLIRSPSQYDFFPIIYWLWLFIIMWRYYQKLLDINLFMNWIERKMTYTKSNELTFQFFWWLLLQLHVAVDVVAISFTFAFSFVVTTDLLCDSILFLFCVIDQLWLSTFFLFFWQQSKKKKGHPRGDKKKH